MTTATKPKGIILPPDLIRRLLRGEPGQWREPVKPQPKYEPPVFCEQAGLWFSGTTGGFKLHDWWPAGVPASLHGCAHQPGAVRYVKERCIQIGNERTNRNGTYRWPTFDDEAVAARWFDKACSYVADLAPHDPEWDEPHGTLTAQSMPAWASRLWIRVTAVRCEQAAGTWEWVYGLERVEAPVSQDIPVEHVRGEEG